VSVCDLETSTRRGAVVPCGGGGEISLNKWFMLFLIVKIGAVYFLDWLYLTE